MADSGQISNENGNETGAPDGTITDKAAGRVAGRILFDAAQESLQPQDKGRKGRLERAAAIGRVKARWQRHDYNAFQRRLKPSRLEKDRAALEKAFAFADDVPVFKEALDWAREHGIEFFVDRTCSRYVGAYYTPGIGAVGVNHRVLNNPQLMAIYLTHEIRHGFQDVHGLLGHSMKPNFAGEAIRTALIEADAMAFETLAAHQAARAVLKKRQAEKGLPPDLAIRLKRIEKYCADEKADLWRGFGSWFQGQRVFFYSDAIARREAAMLGMKSDKPVDHKYEFRVFSASPCDPLPDIADDAQFQKLGKTFSGDNYLNDAKRRDFVLQTVNNPSLARSFWRAGAKPSKLVSDLRKTELQMKHDTPRMTITASGWPEQLPPLAARLTQLLRAVKEVAAIAAAPNDGSMRLEMTVTFKKGVDPVTAFRAAAAGIDGQWKDAAPAVSSLSIEGKSKTLRGARGRLGRDAYQPPRNR